MSRVTFNNSSRLFYQAVKKSVDDYFENNRLQKTGNWNLYVKAVILIPVALALYGFLVWGSYHWLTGVLLAALLGLSLVCIAFNIMHDACHGSYSRKKWVNELMGLSMNALGSNAFIWKIKHNIIHHTYTNIDGIDDDLANSSLLRMCNTQQWRPMHRFQFIYMYLLYAISTLAWMWGTDFAKYFSRKIHNTPIRKINLHQHIVFWTSKLLYMFVYVAVPVYFVGWQPWLIGFLVIHAVMGLALSIVFQLAHVVEKTTFEAIADKPKVIASEWAVHEVSTTANFAPENKLISWLVGGLNFQIEHHLFPQISHVHYPALSKIVRQQCELFDLPYNYYPTMHQAIYSHIRLMKQLGRPDAS
ncbi:acyl-CoA desaturase [Paraflavitalea sp. CAU 1676]|uniref:fatty acid desaturase family protein n=1 Tax=Paraflavitalea sp. CAU 1676 TaxID=3032598 RepID=UPI0023DC94AD|nr:acyl-CoA desaturase [Paraflavitalea sp. CAU 1676]MDF2191246.1 acyl-CoA desaturase [Paraflavitalea sp. CAU 1676]